MERSRKIAKLLFQQSALATFGSFAFREIKLQKILTEASKLCAQGLEVPYAKICRYREEHDDLLIEAGYGWRAGVVGSVVSSSSECTTQGRAFVTAEPVFVADLSKNHSFSPPSFYATHGIVSTLDVIIQGHGEAWGVLEVASPTARDFNQEDIDFLTGFSNVIAEAVALLERTSSLQVAIEQKGTLIIEKDRLLAERSERETRLRELQAELLHVARLSGMGQMTAAIAHELNQPLAAIANYVNAAKRTLRSLKDDPDGVALALETLDKASAQTLRAGATIKNLREFVEKRGSHPTIVDINELIEQSIELALFGAVANNLKLTLDLDPSLPKVMADKVQIQQVLVNLIRNSDEAMLQVERRELIIASCLGKAGFINVTVRDTGPGLPPEVSQKLFTPFITTKKSGMGLGLMISQTLVKANGGVIWMLPHLSKGTAFCFSVRLADAPINAINEGTSPGRQKRGGSGSSRVAQ